MPKQIIESYKKWWDGLDKTTQDHYMNSPHTGYLFTDSPDIAEATTKRGASGTGGGPVNKRPALQAEADSSQSSSVGNTSSYRTPSGSSIQSSAISSNVPQDIEMGLPGTGQGTGGAGDGNSNKQMAVYSPERPISIFGHKVSTYRKVHRFLSFAIAPTWISTNLTTPTENQRYLTTALAEIPWHIPALYLNPSEFALIPNGSFVKEVRIHITHRGNRIAFETGEVATRLATLNQIQNIMTGFGLNKTGWGVNRTYTSFNATNGMIPTALGAAVYTNLPEDFYGVSNSDPDFNVAIPTHQIGSQFALDNYFVLANATQNFGGVPPLVENIQFMDGKTTINTMVAQYSYQPKFGMLKLPLKHIRSGLPLTSSGAAALVVPTNGSLNNTFEMSMTATQDATGAVANITQVDNAIQNNDVSSAFTVTTPIEKSQEYKQGPWGQYKQACIQPSCHVGLQAIPSLTATGILDPIANWTDAQADWDVVCEMDVVEHLPTKLPYATDANVPAGEVIYRALQDRVTDDACSYAGLYPTNGIRRVP